MEPTTCVWRIIGQEDIMGTLGNVVKLEDRGLLRVEVPEEKCRCRGGDGVLVFDAIKGLWLKS